MKGSRQAPGADRRRGLNLENRYAGASMPHRGLFTLLDGRSHVVRNALLCIEEFIMGLIESLRPDFERTLLVATGGRIALPSPR